MKSAEKSVLIVSYHFSPDLEVGARRPSEFAKSLSEQGYAVDLLTRKRNSGARPGYISDVYAVRELPSLIDSIWAAVKRITSSNANKAGSEHHSEVDDTKDDAAGATRETLLGRLKRNFLAYQALLSGRKVWTLSCFFYLLFAYIGGKRYNYIISSSPPECVSFIGMLASKVFSAQWICDLRDPLNQWDFHSSKTISRTRVAVESWLEEQYFKQAHAILVTTPSYYEELQARFNHQGIHTNIKLLFNGYDRPVVDGKKRAGKQDINLVYAGTLYMGRDPFPLLEAIASLLEQYTELKDSLYIHFYGNCDYFEARSVRGWVDACALEKNVILHGGVKPEELDSIYMEADVLVVLAQKQPRQIPAKIFEYMPYRKNMLVVAEEDSDTARLARQFSSAYIVPSSKAEVINALQDIVAGMENGYPDSDLQVLPEYSRASQNKILLDELDKR